MNEILCPILSGLGDLGIFYCREECRAYTDRVPSKCLMIELPPAHKEAEAEITASVADGMRGLLKAYKENLAEVDKERRQDMQQEAEEVSRAFGMIGSFVPQELPPCACGKPSVMADSDEDGIRGLCIECLEKAEGHKEP